MLAHPTIMYADWLFVPFNFLAARVIDWRRGLTLFTLASLSVTLVVLTHAVWQAQSLGPYSMITAGGTVMPAAWVHVAYATIETTLLLAFVLCRRADASVALATGIACAYLVALGVGDYIVHHRIVPANAVIVVGGLVLLLVRRA